MEVDPASSQYRTTPLRSTKSWVLLGCCLSILGCQPVRESVEGRLEGAWRRVESRRIQAGEETVDSSPGPNLYLFTEGHYSITSLRAHQLRGGSAVPWQPSEEEKCARYDAFTVNSGTYEVVGGALVTRPVVARAADFVGGTARYEYRISGDTLWLRMVDERSADGVPAPWVGTRTSGSKLVRIE